MIGDPLPTISFKIKKGLHVLGTTQLDGCVVSKGLFPISGGGFSIGSRTDFWDNIYIPEIGKINFGNKGLIVDSMLTSQLSGGILSFDDNELVLLSTVSDISSSFDDNITNITTDITNISAQIDENTQTISEIANISGNFVRLDLVNNFLENNTFQGDVDIVGTLTVAGSSFKVDLQHVNIDDNIITINNGETGTGVTNISSGFEVDRGSEPDYFFIFNEIDDTFQIGESTSLQRVATRGESITDGRLAFGDNNNSYTESSDLTWNDTTKTLEISGDASFNEMITLGTGVSGNHALQKDQIDTLVADVSSFLQNKIDEFPTLVEVTGVSGVPTVIACVPIADTNEIIWELVAIDENNITRRYSSTISAIHDGGIGVNFTEYAILNTGGSPNLDVNVTSDGTFMCLVVTGASFWTIQVSTGTRVVLGGGTTSIRGLIVPTISGRSLLGNTDCTGTSNLTTSNVVFQSANCNGNLRKMWVTWVGTGTTNIFGNTFNSGDTKVFCPGTEFSWFSSSVNHQKWRVKNPGFSAGFYLAANNSTTRFDIVDGLGNINIINLSALSPSNRINKNCYTLPWDTGLITLIPVNSLMS